MMILFLVERVHVACYLNPVEACFLLFRFSDALIVCCLHWSLGRRQLIPHVQVPFSGRKVNRNQSFAVRASSAPNL